MAATKKRRKNDAPKNELVTSGDRGFVAGTAGDQAKVGRFARVIKGKHQGRYGVVESVASVDKNDAPKTVIFRTRDDESARLTVNYADLEPADAGGR